MTEEIPKKIVQPLDIKDEARPHSLTRGDIDWPRFPPAAESFAACVEKGLITVNPDGSITGHKQPFKSGWGYIELKRLVEALWPDIPPAGVDFEHVIERAKLGRMAIAAMGWPTTPGMSLGMTPDAPAEPKIEA